MNMDIIDQFKTYISNSFGESPKVLCMGDAELSALPLMLRANYSFYNSTLLGFEIVLLVTKDAGHITPMQMERNAQMLEKKFGKFVVHVIERMEAYNVGRLIARRVNFVIPGKQAFIPQMLTHISKPKVEKKPTEQILPIAQVIILRQLLKHDIEGKTSYELVDTLSSSYPTINRAVNWLAEHEIISMEGLGEKVVRFNINLLEQALNVCTSPIKRIIYTDAKVKGTTAGVNALAQYTMINEDEKQCYAMTLEQLKTLNIQTDTKFGDVRIEIWRYNPQLLTDTDIADPLSVYFSLKENQDERIQIELEHLINEKSWLEA